MTDAAEAGTARASIASVDARVARLEESHADLARHQVEQDGVMRLIQLEQQHIREIMTSRFVGLEGQIQSVSSKLDTFMGKMDTLISEGQKQSVELEASPLGRLISERLAKTEQWVEVSKEFHAEQAGQRRLITGLVGTNVLGAAVAIFALLKAIGVL